VISGAVGIEMAAEIKLVHPAKSVKLIHSHEKLLSSEPLPDDMKDKTLELIEDGGVEVLLGQRVTSATKLKSDDGSTFYKVVLGDGRIFSASHVIWAISKAVPTSTYLPAIALDSDQLVKIDARMNFTGGISNASSHFAIGDLVSWSGIKRCGAAMAMGHNAAFNIHQQVLEARTGKKVEFIEFPEVPPMIALAVGKKAISYSPTAGTEEGVEVMRSFFGDDLGLKSKWSSNTR
jgi:NADH dehydrogenase FAD-containing subunit